MRRKSDRAMVCEPKTGLSASWFRRGLRSGVGLYNLVAKHAAEYQSNTLDGLGLILISFTQSMSLFAIPVCANARLYCRRFDWRDIHGWVWSRALPWRHKPWKDGCASRLVPNGNLKRSCPWLRYLPETAHCSISGGFSPQDEYVNKTVLSVRNILCRGSPCPTVIENHEDNCHLELLHVNIAMTAALVE